MLKRFRDFRAARCAVLCTYGILCACFGYGLSGCGKKTVSPGAESESAEHGTGDGDGAETASGTPSKKKAKKGESIGGIPKDVWFDDPLTIASNNATIGGAAAPKAPAANGAAVAANTKAGSTDTTKAASEKPAEAAAPFGGKDDWKSIISGEVIAEETKKIKTGLTDRLSNVGKYNGNYKDFIQVDGAVLAALAGIAAMHPDPAVSWKADAKYVRDLSSDIASKAKGLGQASYDPTKQAFDKLDGVLSGNKPPDLGDAAPTVPFSEVVRRPLIMKRMERGYNLMKSTINTEEVFKKSAEEVTREATLLATLAKVAGTAGYDLTDEPEFQKFVNEVVTANLGIVAAVKNGDFKAYGDGLNRCFKACTDCHTSYKNN